MVCENRDRGALSVPQSRPASRQSGVTATPSPGSEELANLSTTLPEMSWSRTSLQDDLFQSVSRPPLPPLSHSSTAVRLISPNCPASQKTWVQECLSLTLEEIVHIRSVLTKAELEALPVDGHVKEDVEKRKVCFLCLKTRFSIFGPWGQKCRLCKRTVCAKCHSKVSPPRPDRSGHFSPAFHPPPPFADEDTDRAFRSRACRRAQSFSAELSGGRRSGRLPAVLRLEAAGSGAEELGRQRTF